LTTFPTAGLLTTFLFVSLSAPGFFPAAFAATFILVLLTIWHFYLPSLARLMAPTDHKPVEKVSASCFACFQNIVRNQVADGANKVPDEVAC
jgi:hypothetical protein